LWGFFVAPFLEFAMMRLPLHVDYEDGSGVDVVASAPDLIAFERKFDMAMSAFGNSVRVEWMLWLAWTTLTRKRLVGSEFDTWSETVDGITFGESSEAEIPPLEITQPIG